MDLPWWAWLVIGAVGLVVLDRMLRPVARGMSKVADKFEASNTELREARDKLNAMGRDPQPTIKERIEKVADAYKNMPEDEKAKLKDWLKINTSSKEALEEELAKKKILLEAEEIEAKRQAARAGRSAGPETATVARARELKALEQEREAVLKTASEEMKKHISDVYTARIEDLKRKPL